MAPAIWCPSGDVPVVQYLGRNAGVFNVIRIYPTRGVGFVVMGTPTKHNIDAVASLALDDNLI